jgi:hypothetical protein
VRYCDAWGVGGGAALINVSSGSKALKMSINRQQNLGFFLNRVSDQLLPSE